MSIRSFHRAQARRLQRETRRASLLARRGRLLAGATLGATTLMVANAQAATTYTVTTTGDDASPVTCPTPSTCVTLRDAIYTANNDGGANTITFASGLSGTIDVGHNGALAIHDNGGLNIQGPGAGTLAVSGVDPTLETPAPASQVFTITGGNSSYGDTISGLTITDGTSPYEGGAVADTSRVPLTLSGDTISASTATDLGGGVFSRAPLTISASTITGNTALQGGGVMVEPGYYGCYFYCSGKQGPRDVSRSYGIPLMVEAGSQITKNTATDTSSSAFGGGGILAEGESVLVKDSTVSSNTSASRGGGISAESKYGTAITGSTVSGNTAASDGGGLELDPISGGHKYSPTEIANSTVADNSAAEGAGIHFRQLSSGSPTTITGTTISGNTGAAGSFGGGLLISGYVGSPFELSNSTISGNSAWSGGGVSLGDSSGYPLITSNQNTGRSGSITFDNSTIASNSATVHGGGIYLGHYTTSDSTAVQSGTAAIDSTIVSGNSANGSADDLERADTSTTGGFTSAFSLIQTPGSAPLTQKETITGVDPKLGALANNGGPTQTMLPSSTSPVIDQGHAALGLSTDQIGNARTVDTSIANPPGGDGTDIGAVELTPSQVTVPTPPPTTPPNPGFSVTVGNTPLGGSTKPLVVSGQTPVTCKVTSGNLGSCTIEVKIKGMLFAQGGVGAQGPTNTLRTTIQSTESAEDYLAKHYPLGVDATAYAVGAAQGPATVVGRVHLLGEPSMTIPTGNRSPHLSKHVLHELDLVAMMLSGTRTVTCTAYTNKHVVKKPKKGSKHHRGLSDTALTKAQAREACARLVKDGVTAHTKSIGRGHAQPSTFSDTGGNAKIRRRLVISFTY